MPFQFNSNSQYIEQPMLHLARVISSIPTFVSLLKDDDPVVRESAVEGLRVFSSNAALEKTIYNQIPTIVEFLVDSSKPDVQVSAVEALRVISNNAVFKDRIVDTIPVIVSLLNNDNHGIRKSAIKALDVFSSNAVFRDHAILAVVSLLNSDHRDIRESAVEALRVFSSSAAFLKDAICEAIPNNAVFKDRIVDTIPVIVSLLNNDNRGIRESAIKALGVFSSNAVFRDHAILAVVSLLNSDHRDIRESAVEALRVFSSSAAFLKDAICKAIPNNALFKDRIVDTIPAIVSLLNNDNYGIPESAIKALDVFSSNFAVFRDHMIHISDAIPAVVSLLNSDHRDIRESAVEALRAFSSSAAFLQLKDAICEAIPIVITLTSHNNPEVRESAEKVLLIFSSQSAFAYKIAGRTTDIVLLKSSDEIQFRVPIDVIWHSVMIRNMLEDVSVPDGHEESIPLWNISSTVLEKVLEYCTHHRDDPVFDPNIPSENTQRARDFSDWDQQFITTDQEMLFEIILAANFLYIKHLLDLGCWKVSQLIKGKTPAEIRKLFNIVSPFTPEEEARIIQEDEWAEDR